MLLKDKVVIVSGIGPGLGQELAFAAAREGAHVVLAARTQSFLDEIEAKLREAGSETLAVSTDISDRAPHLLPIHRLARKMWRPALLMGAMALTTGLVSSIVWADQVPGTESAVDVRVGVIATDHGRAGLGR